jgi:hypothetical protein
MMASAEKAKRKSQANKPSWIDHLQLAILALMKTL